MDTYTCTHESGRKAHLHAVDGQPVNWIVQGQQGIKSWSNGPNGCNTIGYETKANGTPNSVVCPRMQVFGEHCAYLMLPATSEADSGYHTYTCTKLLSI